MYIDTHTHTYIYTYIYIYIDCYMYIHSNMYIYQYIHIYIIHIRMYISIYIYIYIHQVTLTAPCSLIIFIHRYHPSHVVGLLDCILCPCKADLFVLAEPRISCSSKDGFWDKRYVAVLRMLLSRFVQNSMKIFVHVCLHQYVHRDIYIYIYIYSYNELRKESYVFQVLSVHFTYPTLIPSFNTFRAPNAENHLYITPKNPNS